MRKVGFGLLVLIIALAIPMINCNESSEPPPATPQTDDTPIAPPPVTPTPPPADTPIAPPETPVP